MRASLLFLTAVGLLAAAAVLAMIINIAAYKFAPLRELRDLRARLTGLCKGWSLKEAERWLATLESGHN